MLQGMKFALHGATPRDSSPDSIDLQQFARSVCNATGLHTLNSAREA
jgi:hypothetical protein